MGHGLAGSALFYVFVFTFAYRVLYIGGKMNSDNNSKEFSVDLYSFTVKRSCLFDQSTLGKVAASISWWIIPSFGHR